MDGYPEALRLSPADWPKQRRGPRPGDLAQFLTQGFGLGAPAIITPYGKPPESSFYGFDEPQAHPLLNAPSSEASGGTFYFDDGVSSESLEAALSLAGVYRTVDYVAFAASSRDPPRERYLDQLRFISTAALGSVFGAEIAEPLPKQSFDVVAAAAAFVAAQKQKWNDGDAFSAKLVGTAGGDGDWAKESLAFGFHVENTYWGVYRLWSRPWLVTK
ncbi:MAG TPA: hypothetical protein VKS78_05155 [Roseiarcus sp.]|nr:hypothetical protein [Roseiarcus sp.]